MSLDFTFFDAKLRDFAERSDGEKLGMPKDDGKAASLIDILHRILWLVGNERRKNSMISSTRRARTGSHCGW